MDRTIDIVRAAAANRLALGTDMRMDETATLASFLLSKGSVVSTAGTDATMEVEGVTLGDRGAVGEDMDEGENAGEKDEEEGSKSRRRRDEEEEGDQKMEVRQLCVCAPCSHQDLHFLAQHPLQT